MTILAISAEGELLITLRGDDENRVLTTLRRWPYWLRADIERDPLNPARTLGVTLVTDRLYESTIREILKRSFGMTFPVEGGSMPLAPQPPTPTRRRG